MGLDTDITRGLAALRAAVLSALDPPIGPSLALAGAAPHGRAAGPTPYGWLLSEADGSSYPPDSASGSGYGDAASQRLRRTPPRRGSA